MSLAEAGARGDHFGVEQAAFFTRSTSPPGLRFARLAVSAPPEGFFVGSAIFHYLGPAFAVLLFVLVEPLGVAWIRIATAALVFALWRRPWRAFARLDASGRLTVIAMGVVLATMNACFYVSIDHLPLGTVAAIEFSR